MIEHPYQCLQDAIEDPLYPEVDLALRRGRHIGLDEPEWYTFLNDAQPFLEPLYRRYGCELVRVADGYFYLLPTGDRLGRRQLSRAEMLVGQGLALIYLDPATTREAGRIGLSQLVELLANLVGNDRLATALGNRKQARRDQRIAEQTARKEIHKALHGLERLGFVEELPGEQLRLRAPIIRFADPVRGLRDPAQALTQLLARGEITRDVDAPAAEDDE